ncbi:hypothetical protein CCAX7_001050 [Capsulimonas corticalis]|uniref:Uncharacterized protein n=1 Tax=Capsulimonas corticalis TaxID=2219043 RepID=A0A402CRL3_9BACT|nr:hypothetical protein [Capsulimonas corticalis]BDI28054.1 hypothetical protein CCAX7_001050 [Capsulimonas corticalis]
MENTYRYRLSRLVRTQSSEIFLIWDDDRRIGQLDLHYAHDTIHATLVLEADLPVNTEEELLSQIDEDIVSSYLPSFDREDFLVTVFRGEEISSYTDSSGALDDIEDEHFGEDDDDDDGGGLRGRRDR